MSPTILLERTNDALKINPPVGQHHLTTSGSDWLWTVFAIYLIGLLIMLGTTYFARAGERIFHYLFTAAFFVGTIAYFTAASDLGNVAVQASMGDDETRQIFYVKYINWFLSWPPLLVAIGLLSGVSWSTMAYNVFLSWTWIISYLVGSLIASTYKWGYFTFGTFAYFLLTTSLIYTGSITSKRLGVQRHYLALASYLSFIFLLYPIAWGLDDGGNEISVTSGWVFFGILDVLTVPVVAAAVLFLSRSWDYGALNIYFTQYGRVAVQSGHFPEKTPVPAGAPAAEGGVVDSTV